MSLDADRAMVRRAGRAVALRTTALVVLVVTLISAGTYAVSWWQERAETRTQLADAVRGPDAVADPPSGLWVVRSGPQTRVRASSRTPTDWIGQLAARPDGWSTLSRRDTRVQVYAVTRGGVRTVAATERATQREELTRLGTSLLLVGLLGSLLAVWVGWLIGRAAVQPLARALAVQRRFVADTSHELRTPLAVLSTRLQLLRRRAGLPGWVAADVDRADSDVRAMSATVDDLLASAEHGYRGHGGTPVDLTALVRDVAASWAPRATERDVGLVVDATGPVPVLGVPAALRRAVVAVLDNAVEHSPRGGRVSLRVLADEGCARVVVGDDGPGLDDATLGQAGEPFVRGTDGATSGATDGRDRPARRVGLGLALVRDILALHEGRLLLANGEPRGALVTLELPDRVRSLSRR
jgi:signal transduction histidine kinase